MLWKKFFPGGSAHALQQAGYQLYLAAVAQARQPVFYQHFGVTDSLDGRFDLIVLHVFLLSRALAVDASHDGQQAAAVRQELIDLMFRDMDQSLREMGVGDVSIGKKIQKMAYAANGRLEVYEASFDSEGFEQNLRRNLYRSQAGSEAGAAAMARYAYACDAALKVQFQPLINGKCEWPDALPFVLAGDTACGEAVGHEEGIIAR